MDDDREDRIRERAHQIWQREGSPEGSGHDHWHRAEREIDAENSGKEDAAVDDMAEMTGTAPQPASQAARQSRSL